jgi:serine protease
MAKKKPSRPTRPTASGRRPSTRSTGRRPRAGTAVAPPVLPGGSPGAYEATCRALVVFAAPSERSDATARAIAEAAVRASIGEGYVVEPLGAGARDYRVSRADSATIPVGEAWAAARALEAHRDIADAEPAIDQPGLEPPPGVLVAPAAAPVIRPRDFSAAAPLPCAATNPEWSLELCRVKQAWALAPPTPDGRTRGEGIVVGHPDTGYTRHAELFDASARVRVADSYDFVLRKPDAIDPLEPGNPGHGTTTASVIMSSTGAAGATGRGVSGVAPAATLVPLRVTPRVVLLGFDRLAEAIRHAADKGCHVISMSLGGVTPSGALERAVAYAVSQGVVVLAAAGNVWPWVVYPARLDQVIACAACNCQGGIWKHSASGDTVDVTAPGETVWVARPGKDAGQADDIVDVGSGTSYAVATTAGACALWLAFHGREALIARYGRGQLAAVFKEVLMTHGVNAPRGWRTDKHGAGILDVERLLRAPLPATPPASGLRIRASVAPRGMNDVDRFLPYYPGVEPAVVRRGLVRALGTTDGDLPLVLAELGDELLFQVATNPDVRARVLKGGGPKKRGAVLPRGARPGAQARAITPTRLAREGSAALRARLG